MNYVLIAIICLSVNGNCEVEVIDHNLTKSDCQTAQPADTDSIRFDCEIQGKFWEGEKW